MPRITKHSLRKYAAIGLLACVASWAPVASAQSQPPVVVMDSTTFGFYSSYDFSSTQWRGPAFTTGTVPTRITEITFGLNSSDPATPATLRLFQLDDTTELPVGTAIASASLPIVYVDDSANLSPNTYTAAQLGTIPSATLLANKKYALILSGPAGINFSLSDNDSPPQCLYLRWRFLGSGRRLCTNFGQRYDLDEEQLGDSSPASHRGAG